LPEYSKNRIIPLVYPVCFLAILLYLFSARASFQWKLYLIRDGRFRVEPFEIRKGKKAEHYLNLFIPLYLLGRVSIFLNSKKQISLNLINYGNTPLKLH